MSQWQTLASKEVLSRVQAALEKNGISSQVVPNGAAAKEAVLKLVPEQAEVMTMTSRTLETVGLVDALNDETKYQPVKSKLMKLDRATQNSEMQKLGAAPDWAVGSVHAITENGEVVIASNTGSQLPAYAYGAQHVIWVVGTQKIVSDLTQAMKRLEEYTLPLESERARQAYGVPGSNISKLLIVKNEVNPGRLTVILVEEELGF